MTILNACLYPLRVPFVTCSFPPSFGTFFPFVIIFLEMVLADTTLVLATNLTTFNYPGLLGSLKLLYCSLLAMTLIFTFPLAFPGLLIVKRRLPQTRKKQGTRQEKAGFQLSSLLSPTLN